MSNVGSPRGVVVLGGTEIGATIGRAFSAAGDIPYCLAREQPLPGAFVGWRQVDCTDPVAASAAVSAAFGALGRIDVLVLAAARMPIASAAETTDEQWRRAIDDGLTSAFNVVRAVLPRLPAGGSIVAVGSTNSFLAAPGLAAYAAAKAGLSGLIRQLALDYGGLGIRANIVAPALISHGQSGPAAEGYPIGRVGHPDDVAHAAVFLASPQAAFITGVTLPVDGGLSIASPAAFLRPDLLARFPRATVGPIDSQGLR